LDAVPERGTVVGQHPHVFCVAGVAGAEAFLLKLGALPYARVPGRDFRGGGGATVTLHRAAPGLITLLVHFTIQPRYFGVATFRALGLPSHHEACLSRISLLQCMGQLVS
jgi:hypothetical protein